LTFIRRAKEQRHIVPAFVGLAETSLRCSSQRSAGLVFVIEPLGLDADAPSRHVELAVHPWQDELADPHPAD